MSDYCVHIFDQTNVVESVQGKNVFKDECVLCFNDTRSEKGVDLCLTCLQGFCEKNNHTQEHFNKTNHPVYLNIKATPKAKEFQESQQITRLAIGVEGGAKSIQIEYDTKYNMVCKGCPGLIEQKNFDN